MNTPMAMYSSRQPEAGYILLGVTNDLVRRVAQHQQKTLPGFTQHYDIRRLVWFECYDAPTEAIVREKELKKWRRDWKIALIAEENPDWRDLYPEISG